MIILWEILVVSMFIHNFRDGGFVKNSERLRGLKGDFARS